MSTATWGSEFRFVPGGKTICLVKAMNVYFYCRYSMPSPIKLNNGSSSVVELDF